MTTGDEREHVEGSGAAGLSIAEWLAAGAEQARADLVDAHCDAERFHSLPEGAGKTMLERRSSRLRAIVDQVPVALRR